MKPSHLTQLFGFTVATLAICAALAPIFGVEITNGDLNLFNGLNLLFLATAGFLIFYIFRATNAREQADKKAKAVTDKYEELLQNERESKRWYKRRVTVLREHQDKFPDPYRHYICNIIANGSILPAGEPREAKTATIYAEDYKPWQWYRLLVDLGIIEDYKIDYQHRHTVEDTLQGDDLKMFKAMDIEVAFAGKPMHAPKQT